jgi:hypothetical protein
VATLAARMPDQELATPLTLLRQRGQGDDAEVLLRKAVVRSAERMAELFVVLREIGDPQDWGLLAGAAGDATAERVAMVCDALRKNK